MGKEKVWSCEADVMDEPHECSRDQLHGGAAYRTRLEGRMCGRAHNIWLGTCKPSLCFTFNSSVTLLACQPIIV